MNSAKRAHRAGVAALLGRPNAGKSTLLNRLLGEELSITSNKPQTTRSRMLGVRSLPEAQLVLLDTPGFLTGARIDRGAGALGRALDAIARDVAENCDLALLLIAPGVPFDEAHQGLCAKLEGRGAPLLVVATQRDRAGPEQPPPAQAHLAVSARSGLGMDALLAELVQRLPESPPLYDADTLTDRPLRFLAAECIRRVVFEELEQELPYAIAVEIMEWDESRPQRTHIRARLLVERASLQGMVIGKGGAMIKKLGARARVLLEAMLERPVHLELRVKVEAKWSSRPQRLRALGYR